MKPSPTAPKTDLPGRTYIIRLAVLVLFINLFIVAISGVLLLQSRAQYCSRAEIVTQNLAQVLEQNISGIVERIDLTLLTTAHQAESLLSAKTVNQKEINSLIGREYACQPELDSLRIADDHGVIRYGIGVPPGSRISLADRDFFIHLRTHQNPGLVIAKPMLGRISGKWVITFARRLNRQDGSFAGVIYAVIPLEHFRKLFATLDLGPRGVVSMREPDLGQIIRYPEPNGLDSAIGNKIVSAEFAKMLQDRPERGTFSARTGLDSIHRTVSYRKIVKYPAYIIVGLSTGDYLTEWRNEASKAVLLILLFCLTTVIGSGLLYHAWNRRKSDLDKLRESESRYRLLFENMTTGFALHEMIYGVDGSACDYRFLELNPAFERLTGIPASDLLGRTVREVMPTVEPYWIEKYDMVASTGQAMSFQDYSGAIGKYFDVWAFSPGKGQFAVIFSDITVRRETEDKLRLMARVFEHSGEALVITGPDNKILATNGAFTTLTGYSQEEALGKDPKILKSGKETREFYVSMWETLLRDGFWQGEIWDKRKDGSLYPKWLAISVVRNEEGEITNYIAGFTDISDRKQAAQKIEHLAHHDPLTNLPNRFSLRERLAQALEQAKRSSLHLVVMFIDLDRFKNINDSLGHHVGDLLLIDVAARLSEAVRSADIVARLGGDEFVVVLPQVRSGVASAHIVSKIQQALSQPFRIDGHDLHITPSIGISVFPHDGETIEELMKNADLAMYHAKSKGRNNYQFFKQEMNSTVHERLLLENDLRAALERQEFLLHYQPQIDLATGRVIGMEALVRWQHPQRGLIAPGLFIPIAEETGLILPLGDFVLKTACRQLVAWQAQGLPPLRMAVNLSARQFKQGNFPSLVAEIIAETGIAPHHLELEITESAAMDNPEAVITHLRILREMGIELAIDDFGTGYSSLGYLKLFPVNRLKIDRSFVKDIESDSDDAAIAAATIALAHTLGKEVIAEGVESKAQLDFLKYQQCDIVQGYFFSRPMPPGEVPEFLRNRA
ncbi:EAL domain-containing protein [Geobacter sp. SVR]|uniref:bifunctional diguanylate cyclase/phosphodiesterase n=1 Tax=Geobacter sp. SVR TaxID=2495594 RepID=UPI00143EFCD6|nr:EAL domain-containing protein [Geobacter sp. SVR]BCS54622.1 hypothetical protein GSVR_29300 [Geobacter sp. SVR]GCF86870.1 hypothetical protein GSbR_34700 [Geobacter sp. SVR]